MPKDTRGRVLEIEPEVLEKTAFYRKLGAKSTTEEKFLARVIRATRELTDLRAKVKALEPYTGHHAGCPGIPATISGPGGYHEVVHQLCTCGFTELQGEPTNDENSGKVS
jgi:hypothetical protein